MTALLLAATLSAFAGTPHCVGMCGGLATAGAQGGPVLYHAARIGTYATLGAVAGAAGRWIPGPSWVATLLSAVLLIGMAASLAGYLPEPRVPIPGLARMGRLVYGRSGPPAALALGVLNGLLPCGLLYATLALPVAAGDAWSGALVMAVFGMWTALPLTLAASGLRRVTQQRPWTRKALAVLVLITGLAGLSWRVPQGGASEVPACHAN